MNFRVTHQKVLKDLPSSSGIVKHDDFYYAIGDDSPFLFKLDREFEIIDRFPIHSTGPYRERERIPKKDKPDFEALAIVSENEIIGFGSGSRSPGRDDFIRVVIDKTVSVEKYKLTGFYNTLKKQEILKGCELNIEAAACTGGYLYLLNRRKNVIFRISWQDFTDCIETDSGSPEIHCSEFKLPQIDGIEAGFSGASECPLNNVLLLTASVERTDNAYNDGEISGSFIGVGELKNSAVKGPIRWIPIQHDGPPLKVESIAVDNENAAGDVDIVLATDSDGGPSLLLKGRLTW